MANSHPGSYCGQDAYNDMFVTEKNNDRLFTSKTRTIQDVESGVQHEDERLQGRNGFDREGGADGDNRKKINTDRV